MIFFLTPFLDVWNCQKHEQHVKRLKEFEEERVAKQEQRSDFFSIEFTESPYSYPKKLSNESRSK